MASRRVRFAVFFLKLVAPTLRVNPADDPVAGCGVDVVLADGTVFLLGAGIGVFGFGLGELSHSLLPWSPFTNSEFVLAALGA